jgi:hypothetical protein
LFLCRFKAPASVRLGRQASRVIAQFVASRRVPQLAQRLGLDLTDTLTRHLNSLPTFQRPASTVVKAKAKS